MKCLCKNDDGTYAGLCNGTCLRQEILEGNAVQMMSERSIGDRVEALLIPFLRGVDKRFNDLENVGNDLWKKGFMEGFIMGYEERT